ncbi:hypothetical protein HPP92_020514 [Vanilla planifolia]|uniref:HMA domain-containing protein n=1 Tax=Vanilla planifolia TaxID=51239 RepID=A0A835Q585_VANPL|nr:hypothetical protein HPP92_020514 [Vanilla planifolia]
MEADGNNALKEPLLKPVENVTTNFIQAPKRDDFTTRKVMFKIGGMSCASCAASIESVVGAKEGVESITVSPLQGQAIILYRPDTIAAKTLVDVIEDMGYQVEFSDQNIAICRLQIKGMACTSCSESVERSLLMVKGVKRAVVGLALEEAKVHFDRDITNPDHLIEAIENVGFSADIISSGDDVNKVYLKVEGIHSRDGVLFIQSCLEAIEGVSHAEFDAVGQIVTITYDPELTGPRSIFHSIGEACHMAGSFRVSLYSPPKPQNLEKQHQVRHFRNQFLWSCLCSIPVLLFSMILPMFPPYGNWLNSKVFNDLTTGMLLRWLFCTPVQFIVGWRYYS